MPFDVATGNNGQKLSPILIKMSQIHLPSAQSVIQDAKDQAREERKNVAIYFHASWCPWCRHFESLWLHSRMTQIFESAFVLAKIDCRDRHEDKSQEHRGWEPIMEDLRGSHDVDVPYLVIVTPDGEKLGDSYVPPSGYIPSNAGYPVTDAEINAFVELIERTGKGFTKEYSAVLRLFLEAELP